MWTPRTQELCIYQDGILAAILLTSFSTYLDPIAVMQHHGHLRFIENFSVVCKEVYVCVDVTWEVIDVDVEINGPRTLPCGTLSDGN